MTRARALIGVIPALRGRLRDPLTSLRVLYTVLVKALAPTLNVQRFSFSAHPQASAYSL